MASPSSSTSSSQRVAAPASCRSRKGRPRSRSFIAEEEDGVDPVTGLPLAALEPSPGTLARRRSSAHSSLSSGSRSSGSSSSSRSASPHGHALSHKTLDIVNNLSGAARLAPSPGSGRALTPPRTGLPTTASSEAEAAAERRLMEELRRSGGGMVAAAGSGGSSGGRGGTLVPTASVGSATSMGGSSTGGGGGGGSGKKAETCIKILMLGDSGVGKTSLISRFSDNKFNPGTISTAGVDYRVSHLTVDGRRVKLQIWDTAGQERFHVITRAYYRGCHGIVLVYDVSDVDTKESFRNIRYWMDTIQQHAGPTNVDKILVGNKVDLPQPRLEASRGKALAARFGIRFFETSAKSGHNVKKVFTSITRDILNRMEGQTTATAGSGSGGKKAGKQPRHKKCTIM